MTGSTRCVFFSAYFGAGAMIAAFGRVGNRLTESCPQALCAEFGVDEEVETPLSRVILSPHGVVIKVKKAVALPWVDLSTPEQRHHMCQEEVRLNSSLAPGVYLGVVKVWETADSQLVVELPTSPPMVDGHLVETGVLMRRLSDAKQLKARVLDGSATVGDIRAVGRHFFEWYARQPALTAQDAQAAAGADAVRALVNRNVMELAAAVPQGDAELRAAVAESARAARRAVARVRGLIDARVGEAREGHGDVRLEHCYLTGDEVRIIDCCEFSAEFRTGDPLLEAAFLAMELDHYGAGPALVKAWRDAAGVTRETQPLFDLYVAHRALVRAKLRLHKGGAGDIAAARRHVAAALRHLDAHAHGLVVMVAGLPGIGRSTLCAAIAEQTGAVVLDSDVVRAGLSGVTAEDVYDPATTARV